jgi:uncharacterized metal-binding protein
MTNNKQQTSVEWFGIEIGKLFAQYHARKINIIEFHLKRLELEQQAKEMEKEQTIRFALCYAFGQYNVSEDLKTHIEKFYEQTYGGGER